jgi:hypothetical protein
MFLYFIVVTPTDLSATEDAYWLADVDGLPQLEKPLEEVVGKARRHRFATLQQFTGTVNNSVSEAECHLQ